MKNQQPSKRSRSGAATTPSADDLWYVDRSLWPLCVPIESLVLDPSNARIHPAANLDALEASVRRFMLRNVVVVRRSNNVIEAGNGTVMVIGSRLKGRYVPAVFVDDDEVDAVVFALGDNRSAELATWNGSALEAVVRQAVDSGIHPETIGFKEDELERLIGSLLDLGAPPIEDGYEPPMPMDTPTVRPLHIDERLWIEIEPTIARLRVVHLESTDGEIIGKVCRELIQSIG